MPDAESFVAAIAANPADDLPRLVFADWLDENGDPARAGFIRDHVALAKLRPGTEECKTLFRKCADTLRANLPAWIQPACDAFGQPFKWKAVKDQTSMLTVQLGPSFGVPLSQIRMDRGLVGEAELDLRKLKDSDPVAVLFRGHPITRLNLSLPQGQEDAKQVLPTSQLSVRSLRLFGGLSPTNLDVVFTTPAFSNVTQLTASFSEMVRQLISSPMAKRINSLFVVGDLDVLELLREYPLDDRLQEFALLPIRSMGRPPSVRVEESGTPNELWPALSRVAFRPTLKRLDLTRCGMTDDGLAAFARGEEWVRLQGLKLGGNLFGDRGWADFCRGWRTPELTYLDASRNRLTDAGAEMLSRSGMLKTLRVIDLRGNRIAGHGAVALARAVAEGKVNRLLLAGNPLGKREAATVKGLLGERTDLASGAT